MIIETPPYMPLGVREYLELEEASSVRHEYVGGILHALAGASRRHNQIITNLITDLGPIANQANCTVHHETVKLQVADDTIYYPDFMIVCHLDDTDAFVVERPCVVVEVVSSSSRVIDRREKVMAYRRVPSLLAYLVIEQDEPSIQRHWRTPEGAWLHGTIAREGIVPIPCLGTELSFEQIYRRIDFSTSSG
ncbi:MAG TPA: Uma2 family endonuclease [Thermomicrobiales bacterium]|nr:Uma2 family endonuclease [Thermomicrobiales bacterium]